VVAGAGHEGVEVRCQRVATACGLDGNRLYAWSRVIAPMFVIAYLTYDGPKSAIDELITLTR
jgi:streptomycin 6-kinase